MTAAPRFANIVWWTIYFAAALALQLHFPGIDAIIPGILLSCQEERPQQTLWLCLIAILIQEGTGSLAFGNSLLWYGSLLLFFAIGRLFFVTKSLFFIVLTAIVLGAVHPFILYTASSLQEIAVDLQRLVEQGIAQALIIPPLYAVAFLIRKKFIDYEYGF